MKAHWKQVRLCFMLTPSFPTVKPREVIAPGSNATSCFKSPRPAVDCSASPLKPRGDAQTKTVACPVHPSPPRTDTHIIYEWEWCALPPVPLHFWNATSRSMQAGGTQMALKGTKQCARGKVSAWAISVIIVRLVGWINRGCGGKWLGVGGGGGRNLKVFTR